MKLKIVLSILSIVACMIISACSNEKVSYEGPSLNVAVIGDIPDIHNENIQFKQISLEAFRTDAQKVSAQYDAVMITPTMFEKASNDQVAAAYERAAVPIIFFDSEKRHLPFVNKGMTYDTANMASLQNGSHTTVYMPTSADAWYFSLDSQQHVDQLYKEIFERVATL
jgi:hypothetical protein